MQKFICHIVLVVCLIPARAHLQSSQVFQGFTAGLTFDFGTRVNRVGVSASAYYGYYFAQANAGLKWFYNFQSIGLRKKTPEVQLYGGLNFVFGDGDSLVRKFSGIAENNSSHPLAVGYTYIRYWDRTNTTQSTGLFNFEAMGFRVLTENDLFAGGKGWRDRFRTGAFLMDYTFGDFRLAITSSLWTGDYIGCEIVNDTLYPARFGYRLAEGSIYGLNSMGLLSMQLSYAIPNLPVSQIARINVGMDSEQVRNFLQNELIHDQPFAPDRFINENFTPHIPMMNDQGGQYLRRPGEKIRPIGFYFNVGMNSPVFY